MHSNLGQEKLEKKSPHLMMKIKYNYFHRDMQSLMVTYLYHRWQYRTQVTVVMLVILRLMMVTMVHGYWILAQLTIWHLLLWISPRRTNIANANGVTSPITGVGTVALSPKLQLHNTLLVPSLSHKLLSVSQVTSDLNCLVLMYPTFYLLQDIITKEIIGCGTKRGGTLLYGRPECGSSTSHATYSWCQRKWTLALAQSVRTFVLHLYQHLFPDLFSQLKKFDFQCETCILAKSHKVSFPLHLNKKDTPFALIHSDVWGPSPITTVNGFKLFVLFVDDCTDYYSKSAIW